MESNKESIKKIIEKCSTGSFEDAINYIKYNTDEKITKIALQLIIACCKASTSKKETISDNDLLHILNRIVPCLGELSGNNRLRYLQSIYHITNFFIFKGSCDNIIQLKSILLMHFDKIQLTDAEKNIYYQIAKLLHHFLLKSEISDHNIFYKISILMVKICDKFVDFSPGLHLSALCFKIFTSMKIGVDYQIEYFKTVLSSLDFRKVTQKCKITFINFQILFSGILSNVLGSSELQKGVELLDYVDHFIRDHLNHKEYINLHQIFKIFFITNHSDANKCIDGLQTFDLIWKDYECRRSLNINLTLVWKSFKDYYTLNSNKWVDFPEELQLLLFKFASKTKIFIINSEFNDTETLNSYLFYLYIITDLIRNYINYNKSSTLEYHLECFKILKIFYDDNNFKKITKDVDGTYWKNLSIYLCNTGLQLYAQKNSMCTKYFLTLLKLYIQLEDIYNPLLIKYEVLDTTCSGLINISTDEEKALFTSLGVILCVRNRDFYLQKWCFLKQKFRDQEFYQQLNLVTVLESLPEELSNLKLDEFDKRNLLKLELGLYKEKWQSRVMINTVLNELGKLSDVTETVPIVVELFIDMSLPFHEGIHCFLYKILEEYKNSDSVSKFNLGVLYYLYYKSCCKKNVSADQEKSTKILVSSIKYENVNCEDDHNQSFDNEDEYDGSSCYNLRINKYAKFYEYLELAIVNIESALDISRYDNNFAKLYNILLEISFEFKLAGLHKKSIRALQLSLKTAQILNEKSMIVKSIGYLIELQENIQNLSKLADNLIEEVTEDIELRIFYYLCKSNALFKNNYLEAYDIFKDAKLLLEQLDKTCELGKELKMLKCRVHLLNFKFTSLPCSLNMESHNKSLIINTFLAAATCIEAYNVHKIDHSCLRSLLIEAFEELFKTFHNLKNVKEVISFVVQMIEFTQVKGLPLYFAKFLLYKAYEHLLSNRQDHCENNIKDIFKILELHKSADDKGKTYTRYYSAASPGFKTNSFQLPATVLHENSCDCFYCDSLNYKELVLEATRISALVNVKQNKVDVAEDYFQGALKLYEIFSHRPNKCSSNILISYGYILLNYSGHLWRTDRKEAAIKINDKVLTFIEDNTLQNVPLYYEVLLQKLGYNMDNIISKSIPDLQVEMNNLHISDDTTLSKTPENKQSNVVIFVGDVEDSLYNIPPERKAKKIVPLIFSPTLPDVNETPKIDLFEKKSHTELEKLQKLTIPSSVKRTRAKTRVLQETDTPSEVTNLRSRTKLLTEKLRKQSSSNDVEKEEKKAIRMNLFGTKSDLASEPKPVGKGAVKKTTRSKK